MYLFLRTGFIALWLSAIVPSWADGMGPPKGPVILTVTGLLDGGEKHDAAHFDLEMLRALDETRIETSTIWTEGTHVFHGTSLAVFIDAFGIEDGTLRATAVNDYSIDIPVSDVLTGDAILAWHMDGAPMSLREKGPLWLVYPYDAGPEYRSEVIYSRSIWNRSPALIRRNI